MWCGSIAILGTLAERVGFKQGRQHKLLNLLRYVSLRRAQVSSRHRSEESLLSLCPPQSPVVVPRPWDTAKVKIPTSLRHQP